MKMPFYTVLGPLIKRNGKPIRKLCSHPALGLSPLYVAVLGVLGMALSIFDIIRIIKCGPTLPNNIWRERLKNGKIVTSEAERDCKLICLVLSAEYYMFLIFGLLTGNPIFFLPFLILYAMIIFMEFLIFFIRIFVDGLEFSKCSLVLSLFMIYNWTSVFCTFVRTTSGCDI